MEAFNPKAFKEELIRDLRAEMLSLHLGDDKTISEDEAAVLRELSDRHAAAFGLPPSRSEAVLPGLPYSGTSKDILYWLRETGLKAKAGKKAAHLLRSTFASWAVSAGVPIYAVSQWLGHSSIAVTQASYAHLAPDYTSEAAEEVFGGAGVRLLKL